MSNLIIECLLKWNFIIWIMQINLYGYLGDNMLTALSVAHDCKMVSPSNKIVLVEAKMAQKGGGFVPQCKFVFEGNPALARRDSTLSEKVNFHGHC